MTTNDRTLSESKHQKAEWIQSETEGVVDMDRVGKTKRGVGRDKDILE